MLSWEFDRAGEPGIIWGSNMVFWPPGVWEPGVVGVKRGILTPDFLERNIFWYTGKLILSKIIKIVATSCQILRLKCIKFDFGRGSVPDPAEGAYSAPPDPLDGFKGPPRNVALVIWPPHSKIVSAHLLIHRESKKGDTILLSISLLNIDRFS